VNAIAYDCLAAILAVDLIGYSPGLWKPTNLSRLRGCQDCETNRGNSPTGLSRWTTETETRSRAQHCPALV
jgi:hypothetical protein